MNIMTIDGISKAYGPRTLFSDVSFSIDSGQKLGLIGLNGAGKSTLLRVLSGQAEYDEGEIRRNQKARIHFLPQEPYFEPHKSVIESVLQGDLPVMDVLRRYEEAVAKNDAASVTTMTEEMDECQAWEMEQKAKVILTKLGISDVTQCVDELSGGQRKRLGLARALIMPCDLLILDEPTNHLDDRAVVWLEQYLHDSKSAIVLSTHDRYFLDSVVDSMIEIDRGKVYSYTGNYEQYLVLRQERLDREVATEEKRQNLLRRETAWIKRGAQARSTKQKARRDRYEALLSMESGKPVGNVEILDTSVRLGKTIIDMDDIAFAYPQGPVLFNHVTYHVVKHDRIGIIGPNGAGKSTFLNLIFQGLTPTKGTLTIGSTVRFGYFTQHVPSMDEDMRVIDYITEHGRYVVNQFGEHISATRLLDQFLFTEEMQYTYIRKLSGGERRRLFLLRILMDQPNVLLLDEPTNDLDIPTLTVLEQWLDTYQGVVLVVSHDRYFLDRVADKLFVLKDGTWSRFYGDYSEYLGQELREEEPAEKADKAEKVISAPQRTTPVEKKGLSAREKEELQRIEEELPQYEGLLKGLDAAIAAAGSDFNVVQSLMKDRDETKKKVDALTERWMELEELAEQE